MAATAPRRWLTLAVRSSNIVRRPVARGMTTEAQPNVLPQSMCRMGAGRRMTAALTAERVFEKRICYLRLAAHRHFSSSSQPRPDRDERDHHPEAADSTHELEKNERMGPVNKPQSFWQRMLNIRQWGLAEVGTAATILCAIDCTVFPVVLTVLPLAQMIDPATSHHISHLTHVVALYFVLPIGSLAVGANFVQHKRWDIAGLGAAGVLTIAAAHMSVLPEWVSAYGGWANTAGCAGLLASGWLSHKVLHGTPGHEHHDHRKPPSCHYKPKNK